MALRLKHKIVVQISRDAEQKQKGVIFLDDDAVQEIDTNQYQRSAGSDISIPDTDTEALSFGDVQAVRGLYLEVSGQCNVTLNGSNVPILVEPDAGAPSGKPGKLMLNATITSVSIENVSGGIITGVYALWGDPLP